MRSATTNRLACSVLMVCAVAAAPLPNAKTPVGAAQAPPSGALQHIDLAERLAAGKLRTVNRDATRLQGSRDGVHVSEKAGPGLVWIEGSDFAEGTIEVDVRGRYVLQRSFVGIAFHGKDDNTYDAVYLRPFNFRAADPDRHQHAVQYMASPDYDWPRLRKEFPEEFENPVDASVVPTDWVPLRVVDRGMLGLWTGNNSDGDFANLRITPMK